MHNKTKINKDKHRTPTINGKYIKQYINNNRTTAKNGQQPKPRGGGGGGGGGFNRFYRRQTFFLEIANALVLTYVVLECHSCQTQYVNHLITFV